MVALNISPQLLAKHAEADIVWCTSLSDPCHSLSDSTILLTASPYVFLNEVKGNRRYYCTASCRGVPQTDIKQTQTNSGFWRKHKGSMPCSGFPVLGGRDDPS